jgi:hypothetical protein
MQREGRISPHFRADKLDNPSVDDVIDVFEDRTVHWLLEPARSVLQSQFGDPASTCLALTYFESIRVYSTGTKSTGQSKAFFVAGFLDVFRGTGIDQELLGRVAEILYADARCGFFHDGLFRQRIFFQRKPGAAIQITVPVADGRPDPSGKIQSILIDAREFLSCVEGHLRAFVARLRDTANAVERVRFFEICRELWDWEGEVRVIGLPG